jgi:hypothetical protein
VSAEADAALKAFIDGKIPKHLRGNFDRDISMIRAGWHAAMEFVKKSSLKWRRDTPNASGLWWWWNEDEDSSPVPVDIALSGGGGGYFAMAGQYGWTRAQSVSEMGGLWMFCVEPTIPDFEERDRLASKVRVL